MSDAGKTKAVLIRELESVRRRVVTLEQSETRHAQAEELYETLANSSPVGVYIYQDGKFQFVNTQFQKHTGFAESELFSMAPRLLIHPEDRSATRQNAIQMLKGQRLTPYEFRIINKSGTTLWAMESVTSITYNGNRATLANFMDITGRKEAEAKLLDYQHELRSLSAQLSLAEERERRLIATDLHDRVSQSLAICKIKLGALLEKSPDESFSKSITDIRALLTEMIKETRTLSFSISSPLLYVFGLDAAVEQLARDMKEQYGIAFHYRASKHFEPLDDDVSVLLYRTVREIFTNILKHSQARHVKVAMRQRCGYLQITVEDDGVGFDTSLLTDNMKKNKALGLFSLRERLSYIGGKIEIESELGIGTRVVITAPVKNNSDNEVSAQVV